MPAATTRAGVGILPENTKICVVMVGLPARGKSYIAQKGEIMQGQKLRRYFRFNTNTHSSAKISSMEINQGQGVQRGQLPS